MEEMDKKKLHKAVDEAKESCIVISDRCFAIVATNGEALALLASFVSQLKSDNIGLSEEIIMDAVKLGFKSEEEKVQILVDLFKKSLGGE